MNEKIDMEIYNESMRIGAASADDKFIWANDEVISGLYIIDKTTFKVKNILDSSQIFKYGKLSLISIFHWKDNVIMVPSELNKKWIIYNKADKSLRYKEVVRFSGRTSGIYIIEKWGILLPDTSEVPIIIIDIESLTIFHLIKNWTKEIVVKDKKKLGARTGTVVNKELFFFVYDTRYFIKVYQKGIDIYEANIPYEISSMDYIDNKLWILPIKGNFIYGIDKTGKIVEKIDLSKSEGGLLCSDFIRIVGTKKYIFLLPVSAKCIYVYHIQNKRMQVIVTMGNHLKNIFPIQISTASYWGYCLERNKLYFMPLENKLIEIDLETLEYKQREMYLPPVVSGHGLKYWFDWKQCFVFNREYNKDSLVIYCKNIKKNYYKYERNMKNRGAAIWTEIKT